EPRGRGTQLLQGRTLDPAGSARAGPGRAVLLSGYLVVVMLHSSAAEAQPGDRASPGRIFVLGRNRSGTKWLTNQISNHPQVAAITATNTGVLEANLFEHLPRMFGDLSINDHYYAFLAAFMKSSFFHRSGLPESCLYEKRHD